MFNFVSPSTIHCGVDGKRLRTRRKKKRKKELSFNTCTEHSSENKPLPWHGPNNIDVFSVQCSSRTYFLFLFLLIVKNSNIIRLSVTRLLSNVPIYARNQRSKCEYYECTVNPVLKTMYTWMNPIQLNLCALAPHEGKIQRSGRWTKTK